MMLIKTGNITMATISRPKGCGVDSRVACSKASTQLLTYNSDINNGFSIAFLLMMEVYDTKRRLWLSGPNKDGCINSRVEHTDSFETLNLMQNS